MEWDTILYCGWTSTRRNANDIQRRGWRFLVSPAYERFVAPPYPEFPNGEKSLYMLDNGAWTSFKKGLPFDGDAFRRSVDRWGDRADWVILPDIVAGGVSSMDLSLSYVDELRYLPTLLPVQDGMTPEFVAASLPKSVGGIFVGGSTEWKLKTIPTWCDFARKRNLWCHVGRVNTLNRIKLCVNSGADSIDGTSATIYSVKNPVLAAGLNTKQAQLFYVPPRSDI